MTDKFKMTPSPADMSDTGIHRLFDDELKPALAIKAALDRLEKVMHEPPEPTNVAELMFHTSKRRRLAFDRVPVGHDLGYRCYDGDKHDPESAHSSGEYGDGLTEDQAYAAWLHALDDCDLPRPRGRITNLGNPEAPPEWLDADVTFDDDLEDRNE